MTTVSSDRIRIKLKAYDYRILDKAVAENFENAAAAVASLEARHQAQRVARDLVFEEEESESVNTRKQEARDGEPFVAHYELVHE